VVVLTVSDFAYTKRPYGGRYWHLPIYMGGHKYICGYIFIYRLLSYSETKYLESHPRVSGRFETDCPSGTGPRAVVGSDICYICSDIGYSL
jgi:hypothetical protein